MVQRKASCSNAFPLQEGKERIAELAQQIKSARSEEAKVGRRSVGLLACLAVFSGQGLTTRVLVGQGYHAAAGDEQNEDRPVPQPILSGCAHGQGGPGTGNWDGEKGEAAFRVVSRPHPPSVPRSSCRHSFFSLSKRIADAGRARPSCKPGSLCCARLAGARPGGAGAGQRPAWVGQGCARLLLC